MTNARIPGFYKMNVDERLRKLRQARPIPLRDLYALTSETAALPFETANHMIENAIGVYPLPLGVALNFQINGKDYLVPMAIEEPSVVASASHIAKLVREAGGFTAEATEREMIGQIQVVGCPNLEAATEILLQREAELVALANAAHPSMQARGGGAKHLQVRVVGEAGTARHSQMLVVHLLVDTCDAMGANVVNTMAEAIAPRVEELTGGKVYLRILSNYTTGCLARARCIIPPEQLATRGYTGEQVRDGVLCAYRFAVSDVYRAVTHNKGVMNGIDAVVMATGNDWRAIEAGAHAYAARFGSYAPMTEWRVDELGRLVGSLELPMPVGTVGGSIGIHPMARFARDLLNVRSAAELAQVVVAVGLAQNLGALKALATDGIQRGHMALHARSIAMAAGATGEMVEQVAARLTELRDFSLDRAKELVQALQAPRLTHAVR